MKMLALVAILGLVGAACGGDEGKKPTETTAPDNIKPGGTLRMAMLGDVSAAFDPQKEYYSVTWEFYRCCLLRTLMSYNGQPTDNGGTEVRPDLAAAAPTESEDGLTWTFSIRQGVNYGDPFRDTEIVAGDFIRALEREADEEAAAGGYSFYYNVIEGFADSNGEPGSISGLTAVDDHTLEVKLTRRSGDLPYLFAMAATAPIPEGASDGHTTDYGRFLVASGPYQFEGADALDFTAEPKEQEAVSGYEPGKSITLVRNPSWSADVDDLRKAYVDRIEVTIGGTEEDLANQVDAGEIDIVFDGVAPAQQIRKYETDPELEDQIFAFPSDAVRYISMNLAIPPFDDIHVRKAVNLAIDKESMRTIRGGPRTGDIAGHIMVDALLAGELEDYNPYETPNNAGDVEAAKAEMAQSKYDTDGDGECDAEVCKGILTIIDESDPYPDQTALIEDNLAPLGLTLDVKSGERTTFMYNKCNTPTELAAFCPSPAWGKDFADPTTFGRPLFGSDSIGPDACCNYSLVGAPADVLSEAGTPVTEVPSVDSKLEECEPLPPGDDRIACWVEFDQMLMEEVVPWVPYLFDTNVDIVSTRITNYTFDQFAGLMAMDQIGIVEEAA